MIDAEKYVEMANANRAKMDRSMGPVERIGRDHDVVLGVFDDPTESEGVGFYVIKGIRQLEALAAADASLHPSGVYPLFSKGVRLKVSRQQGCHYGHNY